MLDRTNIGLLITDDTDCIVWVNGALETYFGVRREDIIGHPRQDFFATHLSAIVADTDRVRALAKADPGKQRVQLHVRGGPGRAERWLEHWSLPASAGAYAGGRISYYADITERHRAQQRACGT